MHIETVAQRLGVSEKEAERWLVHWWILGKVDHIGDDWFLRDRDNARSYNFGIRSYSTQRRRYPPEDLDWIHLRTFGAYQLHPVRAYWHDPR